LRNIAGVIIVDFIDMEHRKDQLQVLEHFVRALRMDKAKPQIAQLTELGLVELTRKRQGQNIYELFGQACPTCGGLGHIVHLPDRAEPQPIETPDRPLLARESSVSVSNLFEDTRPRPLPATPWSQGADSLSGETAELLTADLGSSFSDRGSNGNRRRRRRREMPPRGSGSRPEVLIAAEEPDFVEAPVPDKVISLDKAPEMGKPTRREEVDAPPPELITVEMTPEEQEVYALMGISPLVIANHEVKNLKTAIVNVVLPGQAPTPMPAIANSDPQPMAVHPEVEVPIEPEASEAAETGVSEAQPSDSDELEGENAEDSSAEERRRRRRRSSAR
jgi:ribonuclease E